jgi:hypothetical protein
MIVCHCNRICHRQIEVGCSLAIAAEPNAVLTPVRVYNALGKRPQCGGCLTLAASLIDACCRVTSTACPDCPYATFEVPDTEDGLTVAPADRTMTIISARSEIQGEGRQERHRCSERGVEA